MKININNSEDLKVELVRLSRLRKEQELYLGDQYKFLRHKVAAPSRVIGAVASAIPGVGLVKGLFSSLGELNKAKGGENGKSDWLTKATQIGLPLILNRTMLKNSGWLKKAIVLFASEGAAGQVNKDKISSIVGNIANFIRPDKTKKKHKKIKNLEEELESPNFGIPSDSETY